jgi:hypothetical protein
MAPTTMAPTTRAPTTMAPTTVPPTMSPTTIDASLYEMYGGAIGPNGNGVIDIDKVVFLPLINQYVFVAKDSTYLKIVSQDNLQARYTTDTVFDPAKWNMYNVQQPGLYNIRPKASRFEMYGPYIGTAKTVSKVVFVPSLNQYVFMIGDDGWLKMVRQDNLENRYTAGENTVFDPSKWNNGYNVGSVGGYNVRVLPLKATFYTDVNYSGTAVSLGVSEYDWIENAGIPNDAVSSVKVPSGLRVELYEHGSFEGRVLSLTSDTPDLRVSNLNFNDLASSIKIKSL